MVNRYIVFTEDDALVKKLKAGFSPGILEFLSMEEFPGLEEPTELLVIDSDSLPPDQLGQKLTPLRGWGIPVIYVTTEMGGREVAEVIDLGVTSVLFKDDPVEHFQRRMEQAVQKNDGDGKIKEARDLLSHTLDRINHQINNPLTVISLETQLLQHRLGQEEGYLAKSVEARVNRIADCVDRIKDILCTLTTPGTDDCEDEREDDRDSHEH